MILNDSILMLILGFLLVSVGFNLWLTFRLMRSLRNRPTATGPTTAPLEPGAVVSDVAFERIADAQPVALSTYPQHAKVLVFMGSKCPKCKAKLPELRTAVDQAQGLGVLIWLVSVEATRRMKRFLGDEVLLSTTLRASQTIHDYLNPARTYPYYLFVDAENKVQAAGMVGDNNWQNFREQLEHGG